MNEAPHAVETFEAERLQTFARRRQAERHEAPLNSRVVLVGGGKISCLQGVVFLKVHFHPALCTLLYGMCSDVCCMKHKELRQDRCTVSFLTDHMTLLYATLIACK